MAKTIIEANNGEDFFRLIEKLPPLPKGPVRGSCEENMFKERRGTRLVPVCKGSCELGTCEVVVSVNKRGIIRAECVCRSTAAKRCQPVMETFKTEEQALKWVRKTHCTGDCVDSGYMVIRVDGGDWDAIRFCRKK